MFNNNQFVWNVFGQLHSGWKVGELGFKYCIMNEKLGIKTLGEGWRIKNWKTEVAHSSKYRAIFQKFKSITTSLNDSPKQLG
jgi:hypothetical protein